MNLLNCDGCGTVIRQDREEVREARFRISRIERGHDFFTPSEGWDFCTLGCLATWATHQEIETVRRET